MKIHSLETHVTHACNLTCDGCSHFSNLGVGGHVSIEQADEWMGYWSHRVQPDRFWLVGGEPTTHPKLCEFMEIAAKHWKCELALLTNGWFLDRHPELPALAQRLGFRIEITIHHEGPAYKAKMGAVRELVERWERDHGIQIVWRDGPAQWRRPYRQVPTTTPAGDRAGDPAAILPYDDHDPQGSWEICPAKWCIQLHEGKLWKCCLVTYLPLLDRRHPLRNREAWKKVLEYQPLDHACTDAELRAFTERKVEAVCGSCPSSPQPFHIRSPIPGVKE